MTRLQRWIVLAIVSSALFMIVIDMTVLYTALPRLTHDLAASASEKLWIVNAYPLVIAGLLPGLGTLGDRLGHKKLFITGLIIFGVASLIAAYSPVPVVLIAARVLLAIGAAMMMPATLSIIRITFIDERERSMAIGVWASVASGGAGLGPLIGGVLLEYFSWGSVFLINIPIVLLALLLTLKFIPKGVGQPEKSWDWYGSIQIMIGLIGLVYALKEGSRNGGSLGVALLAAVVGMLAMYFFIRRQRGMRHPLIDFALFKNPLFTAGVLTALLSTLALIGMQLVLTQRLQNVLGYSPLEAGLFTMSIPIASFFSGIWVGAVLHRLQALRVLWVTLLLSGAGLGAYLLLYNGSLWIQVLCMVVLGFGIGGAMTAASHSIMMNAPVEKAGMAASIEEVSFELGGALGVALLGSLSSFVYTKLIKVPDGVQAPPEVLDSLDGALLAAERMTPELGDMIVQAARSAFDQSYVLVLASATGILLIGSLVILLLTKRVKK